MYTVHDRNFAQALVTLKTRAVEESQLRIGHLMWVPMSEEKDETVRALDFSAGVLVGQDLMRLLYAQKVGAVQEGVQQMPAK